MHSSAPNKIPSLNGLRAFSILLVIVSHFIYTSGNFADSRTTLILFDGSLGVRIFFVISGFLITTLLVDETQQFGCISLRNFYIRRILRLWPAQFIYISFLGLLTIFTNLHIGMCNYFTSIFFMKNYACSDWIDGHFWSLAVEEQFYIIWPISFIYLKRKMLYLFAITLILLSPASRALEYLHDGGAYWLSSNADILMIGCVLAIYSQDNQRLLKVIAEWHPAVTRILAAVSMYIPVFLGNRILLGKLTVTLGPTLQALGAAFLIISLIYHRRGFIFRLLNLGTVSYVGTISYSLYIWQMPFLSKTSTYGGKAEWFLAFPVNLVSVVVVGIISYHTLEQPLARLRRRFRSHGRFEAKSLSRVTSR